jgi:hypothetical protein
MSEMLEYVIAVRGASGAAGELRAVSGALGNVGSASKKNLGLGLTQDAGAAAAGLGTQTEKMKGHLGGLKSSISGLSGMAKGMLGGLVVFGGISALKGATEQVTQMGALAQSMHTTMGMNVQTAGEWLAVSQAYGVNTRSLGMSFKTLATQSTAAQEGTKTSVKLFGTMGISMGALKKTGGDMSAQMLLVVDALNKMPPGAQKTADATKLLGRGWQALMPLLSQGSQAIKDQMLEAKAYGAQLGGDSSKNVMKLHEAQIQLKLAGIGLQVMFVKDLLPALLAIVKGGMAVYTFLRGPLSDAFKWISNAVKDTSKWLKDHKSVANALVPVLKALGIGILGLLVINKILGPFKTAFSVLQTFGSAASTAWGAVGTLATKLGILKDSSTTLNKEGKIATIASDVGAFGANAGTASGEASALAGSVTTLGHGFAILKALGPVAILGGIQLALGQLTGNNLSSAPSPSNPAGPLSQNQRQAGGTGGATGLLGSAANWIGGVLGIGATGAVVKHPTLALIAEAGPEAVVPLSSTPGASKLPTSGGGASGDIILHLDGREVARATRRQILEAMARGQ